MEAFIKALHLCWLMVGFAAIRHCHIVHRDICGMLLGVPCGLGIVC